VPPTQPGALARWRARLPALLGLALFALAAYVLHRELQKVSYRDVAGALGALPTAAILLAVGLTAANYLVLTGYDQLAFTYIRKRVARDRIALASFVGFAISVNVGFALLSGTSARYRFYSRWGLTPADLSRVVLFYSVSIWLGLFVVGGSVLTFHPPRPPGGISEAWLRLAGLGLLAVAGAYVLLAAVRRRPLGAFGFEIPIPPLRLVPFQFALGVADWLLSSAVLFTLLPAGTATYPQVVGAFVLAQVVGVLSHVPGGLGVFESMVLLQLDAHVPTDALLGSLILFRVIFFILPLAAALVLLVGDELGQRRHVVRQWGSAFGSLSLAMAPKLLSVFVFASGAVLLFSGATPPDPARFGALARALPLTMLEAAHVAGSVVGVGLLTVSHGIARRLAVAHRVSVSLLLAGIAASLLKGGDWVEALVLGSLLAVLAATGREFDRRAPFWATYFSPVWVTAVFVVVAASVWLGSFAFRHVDYTEALWWRFGMREDAPRFLRASLGAAVALLGFGLTRLLRPAPPPAPDPGPEELEDAAAIVAEQRETWPFLALTRDKSLLWNAARDGFTMYGVRGRTWFALGDPVTRDPAAAAPLIRAFVETADDYDALPVFHAVREERLHVYGDFGLLHVPVGDAARMPLKRAPLAAEGRLLDRFERMGATFRVVAGRELEEVLPAMRTLSDAWLRGGAVPEAGFVTGRFDPSYVRRFPVALLEVSGRLEAFAVVWSAADREALAADLLRHRPDALPDVAEAMYHHLARWGRTEGYRWLDLGMAPPVGVEGTAVHRLWMRIGRSAYAGGEVSALRAVRERFEPVWEPRYLVYPGGEPLRRVVRDLSVIVAGRRGRLLDG
jgi:phosphatidylglycerol lysyltransferase